MKKRKLNRFNIFELIAYTTVMFSDWYVACDQVIDFLLDPGLLNMAGVGVGIFSATVMAVMTISAWENLKTEKTLIDSQEESTRQHLFDLNKSWPDKLIIVNDHLYRVIDVYDLTETYWPSFPYFFKLHLNVFDYLTEEETTIVTELGNIIKANNGAVILEWKSKHIGSSI